MRESKVEEAVEEELLSLNNMDQCKSGFHVVGVLWSQADVHIAMVPDGDTMIDCVLGVVVVGNVPSATELEDIMKSNIDN